MRNLGYLRYNWLFLLGYLISLHDDAPVAVECLKAYNSTDRIGNSTQLGPNDISFPKDTIHPKANFSKLAT